MVSSLQICKELQANLIFKPFNKTIEFQLKLSSWAMLRPLHRWYLAYCLLHWISKF